MMFDRVRRRLELRRSNAARPHRNRHREAKINPPLFPDDLNDIDCDCEDDECPRC